MIKEAYENGQIEALTKVAGFSLKDLKKLMSEGKKE